MSFKSIAIILSIAAAFNSFGLETNLKQSNTAEKCKLVKSIQEPGNKYDALMGVNAINIFGEWSIMQAASANGKPTFPPRDTMISFSFKDDQDKNAIGDNLFRTIQTTSFKTRDGKPMTINKIDDGAFQIVYTHSYENKTPYTSLKVTAKHTVAQIIDHWASKDVEVEYSLYETTPIGKSKVAGKFLFKCNEFDRALDILK